MSDSLSSLSRPSSFRSTRKRRSRDKPSLRAKQALESTRSSSSEGVLPSRSGIVIVSQGYPFVPTACKRCTTLSHPPLTCLRQSEGPMSNHDSTNYDRSHAAHIFMQLPCARAVVGSHHLHRTPKRR